MTGWIGLAVLVAAAVALQQEPQEASRLAPERALIQNVDQSGRCADVGQTPEQRLAGPPPIAPGQPPVLSFKYYEDAKHHRFGNVDVMLDDAGH